MSDSRGVAHPRRLLFGVGTVFVLYACGGTVLERSGGAGATSSGGRTGIGGAGSVGKGAGVSAGGKVGTGGRVGTGGTIGVGTGGGTGCSPPLTACSDGCMDLRLNLTHCGSCFNSCPSGVNCVNGACQGMTSTCAAPTIFCSNFGECLDTNTNPFACGSCFTACNGERCTNGVCDPKSCLSATATFCPSSNRCTELSSDYQNCGACGHACGPADSCQNGKCVPPDCGGSTYCQNAGCTDTNTDVNNCGACDKKCLGSVFDDTAYACNSGTCGCSFIANQCGKACASAFWYCPPDGFMGQPADLCKQTARNGYEVCACKGCLAEIQACSGSASCINSMDCALPNPCPTCPSVFSSCTDQTGQVDPIAEKLVACMNAQCSKP